MVETSYANFVRYILRGKTEKTILMLDDKNFNPSIENNTPLRLAYLSGNIEVVKELLKDKRVIESYCNNADVEDLLQYFRKADTLTEDEKIYIKMKWDLDV